MTEQFARSLLKISVAQICQNVGWHAVQTTPCELLTDILHRYLEELAKTTHRYTAQFGRTKPNVDDLALSFKDINIPLGELEEYVTQVEPVPFAHEIPAFPVYRSNNFQHPKPGSKELLRRPEWVHEHLPALYMENDDIESTPSPVPTELTQSTTPKRLSCEITSLPDGSVGPIKRPLESPGDISIPFKRPRLTSDDENCIPREMTSVVMTASGLLSPTREGKLPEAKTPSKIKSLHEESDSSCESPKGLKDLKKVIEHINGILPNKTKDFSEKDKIKSSGTIVKSKPKLKPSSKSSSSKPKIKKKSQSSVIKSLKTSKNNKNTIKSSKDLIRTPKAKSFKSVSQVVSPLQLILSRCDKVKIEKVTKTDKSIKTGKSNNLDKLKLEEIKKNIAEPKKEDFKTQAFVKLEKITEKDFIKCEIVEVPSREDSPEPRLVIDDDPNRQSEQEKRVRLAALDDAIDAVIKRSVAEVEQVQMEDTIEAVVRGPLANENDIDKSDSSLPKTPTISPPPTPSVHAPTIKIKKQKSLKESNIDKEKKKKPKEKLPKEKLPKEKLPKDKTKDKNKEKLSKVKPDDKNKKIREKIKEKIQSKSGLKMGSLHPLPSDLREENFMHLLPGTHPGLPQPSISPSLSAPPTPRTPHSPVMMPFTSPQMSRGIYSLPTSPHFQQYPFYQHQYQFYSNFQAQNFQSPSQNFPSLSHAHWLAPLAQVRYQSISSPERASPARSPPVPPKLGVGVSPTLQPITPKSPSVSPRPTLTLDGDVGNFENKEKMKTRDKPPKKKHIKIVNNLRWSGKHLTAKRREHKKDKKKDKNKEKDKDLPKLKKKKDKDKEKDRSKEKEKQKEPKESDLEKLKIKPTKDKTIDKEKEKEKDCEKDHDKDKEKDKEKAKIKDKDKKEGKEKKEKKEGKEKEKDKHKSSKEPPLGATGSATPSIPKITVKFGGGSTPDVPKIVIKPVLPPEPTLLKPPSPVRVPTPPPLVKPPTPKPPTKAVSSPPIPPKINSSTPQPPRSSTPVQRTVITETVGAIVDEGGQKIWICPACTRPDDGSPMIGCDDCDDWYHWICIGIVEAPDEEENWYCPRCQLKKKEQKKKKKKRHRSSHDYN